MDITTVLIGAAALAYGVFTIYARFKKPLLLGKLDAMKEKFGNSTGNLIHIIAYTVVPLAAGAVFIYSGLAGHAIF
jgi:hypothetical protein